MDVLAAPGELFEELKARPIEHSNWVLPLVFSCLFGIVASIVMFSQESIMAGILEAQELAIQKQVQSGKLTQAQADQATAATAKFLTPGLMKIFGSVGSTLFSVVLVFGTGVVSWLIGAKALGGQFPLMKGIEASGLALIPYLAGGCLNICTIVAKGNLLATAGPVWFVAEPDVTNRVHQSLSALNVGELWYLGVIAIGISRLSGAAWWRGGLWVAGLWLAIRGGLILLSGLGRGG